MSADIREIDDDDISNYFDVTEGEIGKSDDSKNGAPTSTSLLPPFSEHKNSPSDNACNVEINKAKDYGDNIILRNEENNHDGDKKNEKISSSVTTTGEVRNISVAYEGDSILRSMNSILQPQNDGNSKDEEDLFIPSKIKNTFSESSKTLYHVSHSPKRNRKHQSEETFSYIHPHFREYSKATKKYFKFIQRYHIGDTLPVYFKGQLQMQLRALGVNYLTLGLFGEPGAGKTSFLNTLYTALNGNYVEYSAERRYNGNSGIKSATNQRIELRLTETITVLDNRATDFSKNSMKEIIKQCEGFRENGSIVPENWEVGFKQKFKDFFEDCSKVKVFRNRVQTPIIVNSLEDELNIPQYKLLISTITKVCGFSPIIILTHMDTLTDKNKIRERTQTFSQLQCPRVYTVTNYTHNEHEFNEGTDAVLIEILFNCCLVGDQEMQYLVKRLQGSCCFD